MLKQRLGQKMVQKLSPQQIQLMKLLQIPTATLDQRIKEELEANPALDEGENNEEEQLENRDEDGPENNAEETEYEEKDVEFELDDYLNEYIEDDPSSYKLNMSHYSLEDEDKTQPIAVQNTFHEYLETQLGMLNLESVEEERIAKQIIGSIDDDGYLRREPLAIIDDLLFAHNIDVDEKKINELLRDIQQFDPPGVGARNLQESLLLQHRDRVEKAEETATLEEKEGNEIIDKILSTYFEEFTKKHYQKLQKYNHQLDLNLD